MIGYSYNDISIVPSVTSKIKSRNDVFIGELPIFTAPMSTIVDSVNPYKYECNDINPIVPRNIHINIRLTLLEQYWIAVSLKEAEEHNGPSIVIAYCTCVEHGISGGLSCTTKEQKLAVDCGYTILMRYIPEEKNLYIDSKEPDFSKYDEFLSNEVRYNSLKIKDENLAKELLKINKDNAIKRYEYYQKIKSN